MEIFAWLTGYAVAVFVVAFLCHRSRMKNDISYRYQVEETVQQHTLEQKAKKLRGMAPQ